MLRPLDLGYGGGGQQSHGPDEEQPRRGIYLLDEPEAALSPAWQIAFLRLLWQMEQTGNAQFLIVPPTRLSCWPTPGQRFTPWITPHPCHPVKPVYIEKVPPAVRPTR